MLKLAGLYSHIQLNTAKSVLFLLCLPAIIEFMMVFWTVPISIGLDQLLGEVARDMGRKDYQDLTVSEAISRSAGGRYAGGWWVFLFNVALSFGITYFLSQYILRAKTGAVALVRRSEPRLYNIVENLAISAGLPMPDVEIIECEGMNAYAAGIGPQNSTLTVTRGLLKGLNDNELAGVIAHQLCHIKNHDAKMMTVASTLIGALIGIATVVWRFVLFPTPFKMFVLLAMLPVVVYVLTALVLFGGALILGAFLVRASISHARIFMADGGAVELTKDPDALIGALRKMSKNDEIKAFDVTVQAMMFSWSSVSWLNTHPPIKSRIDALMAYAGARAERPGAGTEVDFNIEHHGASV